MIKLIKQDLESFLCLIGDRRPALSRGDLLRDRKRLALREAADYLFLARGDRSYLFPLEEVYTPDSRAYLCWTADTPPPRVPVDAFYLHVTDASHGTRGSVILLDYGITTADMERAACFAPEERAAHLRQLARHWRDHAGLCSTVEMMAAMGGGGSEWM